VKTDLNARFYGQIISNTEVIRSTNLDSKLTDFGLNFELSPGVVLLENDFSTEKLHSELLSRHICQRNLIIGEVGCSLAHEKAIKKFLMSDQEFGLIFEDDAEVIDDFNFDMIESVLDTRSPIIMVLGWIPGFAISKDPQISSDDEPIELATSPTCAFAYGINRPAAELMIGGHEKIIDAPDWPIYTLNKVRWYSTHSPWVFANNDSQFSTIGVRSFANSSSPIKVLLSRVRLFNSLFSLIVLSKTSKLDVNSRQIVHRLLLRDMLYRYGQSQVNKNVPTNTVIPFPLKLKRFRAFLKVT
jgi:hypothetical protein